MVVSAQGGSLRGAQGAIDVAPLFGRVEQWQPRQPSEADARRAIAPRHHRNESIATRAKIRPVLRIARIHCSLIGDGFPRSLRETRLMSRMRELQKSIGDPRGSVS